MSRDRVLGRLAVFASSVLVVGLVLSPSVAFAAFDPTQRGGGDAQGGLWYVAQQGIDKAHGAGFEGQGVKVAIIDSRINTDLPELVGANIKVREPSYCADKNGGPVPTTTTSATALHGTIMTALVGGNGAGGGIVGAAPKAEILYYGATIDASDIGGPKGGTPHTACSNGATDSEEAFGAAFAQAVADGADIISVSLSNGYSDAGDAAILEALRAGVIVVAAYPNEGPGVASDFLLDSNGTFAVMGFDAAGALRPGDRTGEPVSDGMIDIVAPGVDILGHLPNEFGDWSDTYLTSGSSAATALMAGMLAVVMSKYPDATGNQIMQSVLHSTEQGNGKIVKDPDELWGYGKFDLTRTLAQDPSKYPDVNPLLSKEPVISPSYEEVMGSGDDQTDDSTDGATVPETPAKKDSSPLIWIVGGIILLVVAVIAIAVVSSRRKRAAQPVQQFQPYQQYPPGPYMGQGQSYPNVQPGQYPPPPGGGAVPLNYPPQGQQVPMQAPWPQPPHDVERP